MRVLPRAAFVERPWRNGGGKSWEALADPEGAWSLNLAEIARDGPFSDYSGFDRTLTVVRGDGLSLNAARIGVDPHSFDGGALVLARVAFGPVLVFNVLTRRDRARHEVRRVAGAQRLDGDHAVALGDGAVVAGRPVAPLDLLVLEGDAPEARGEFLLVMLCPA